MSNLPLLCTALIGLIAAPYAINKGTASFSDIAQMMASSKQNNIQSSITGSLSELKGMLAVSQTPPVPAPATAPVAVATPDPAPANKTGTAGIKG